MPSSIDTTGDIDLSQPHTPTRRPKLPRTTETDDIKPIRTTTEPLELETTTIPSLTESDGSSLTRAVQPSPTETRFSLTTVEPTEGASTRTTRQAEPTVPISSLTALPLPETTFHDDPLPETTLPDPPLPEVPSTSPAIASPSTSKPPAARPTTTSQPSHHSPSTLASGTTAAIIIGTIILLACTAYIIFLHQARHRRRRHKPRSPDFSSLASSYEHAVPLHDLQPKGPPATPPVGLDTWLEYHGAGQTRASVWPRVQSPEPRAEVAQVREFRRAGRGAVVCEVGRERTGPEGGPSSGPGAGSETEASGPWNGMVMPSTPDGEFAPSWPRRGWYQNQRSEWDRRWQ